MLSVIVVGYNMRRELPRTLFSLTTPYQRGVRAQDYEVIVIDNGSPAPIDERSVRSFGEQFRYYFYDTSSPSPAAALNYGVRLAGYSRLCLCIDGARIASPGLLQIGLTGLDVGPRAFVATLGWHLGPDLQWLSQANGYDRAAEDALLARSRWQQDGYVLFFISVLAGSSRAGYSAPPAESNALFMHRGLYDELGGFDEKFTSVGGGFVNGDLFVRACDTKDTTLVIARGEGTFHQLHGGASTNTTGTHRQERLDLYAREYQALRGRPFAQPTRDATFVGADDLGMQH